MSDVIIQCIICGAIPLISIPINIIICKYSINKEIQTEQVNNEENVESNNEIENTNRYECQICGCWYKEIYAKCDGIKCECPKCGTMADGVDEEAYKLYLELVGKSIFEE